MRKIVRQIALTCALIFATNQARAASTVLFDIAVNDKATTQPLTRKSLKSVFLLKAQFWATGESIVIVLQPNDSGLHNAFCSDLLEAPCSNVDEAELEKRYQGTLFARVLRANSAAEAAQFMKENPTAVGYFRRGAAPTGARVVWP